MHGQYTGKCLRRVFFVNTDLTRQDSAVGCTISRLIEKAGKLLQSDGGIMNGEAAYSY